MNCQFDLDCILDPNFHMPHGPELDQVAILRIALLPFDHAQTLAFSFLADTPRTTAELRGRIEQYVSLEQVSVHHLALEFHFADNKATQSESIVICELTAPDQYNLTDFYKHLRVWSLLIKWGFYSPVSHLPSIWQLLRQPDPVIVSSRWHQRLNTNGFPISWKPYTTIEAVPCPYCQKVHKVQVKNKTSQYFFTCDTTNRTQKIAASTINRWQLNTTRLLTVLCNQLGIQPNIKMLMASGFWKLGTVHIAGAISSIDIWLCRHLSFANLPRILSCEMGGYIVILTIGEMPELQQWGVKYTYVDLYQFVRSSSRLQGDRKAFHQWLRDRFQRVAFDPTNGDLWVDGKRVVTILPASGQYYFINCLYEQFNQPVSHEAVFDYCCRRLAQRDDLAEWYTEYVPASFTHAMKREIKSHAMNSEVCHEIIESTRTTGGQPAYRLTVPND